MASDAALPHDPFSASTAPLTFAAFLEKMRQPGAADIVKAIKAFLTEILTSDAHAERDADRVQVFLSQTEALFITHPLWRNASAEELEASGEALEKYVMTKLHARTFAVVGEDVERDRVLTARMRALQFMRPEHIEIPAHHRNEQSWLLAQKELQKINQYKAPRDKLVCLLNCCRVINNLLNVSVTVGSAPPGADDFLPVLVFVLLRAQPAFLASNLAYITRFRLHARLVSETAYFFTNLVSAATFLECAEPAQFKGVDPHEFAARLRAAGLPLPPSLARDDGFSDAAPNTPVAVAQQQRGGAAGSPSGGAPGTPSFAFTPSESPQLLPAGGPQERGAGALAASPPPPQQQQSRAAVAAAEASLVTRWSVEELAAVGAAMLASEDGGGAGGGALAHKYAFLERQPGQLTLDEVPRLLADYAQLAQRHEALLRGVTLMLDTSSGAGPQQPTPQQTLADAFAGLGAADASTASLESMPGAGDGAASLLDQ